MEHWFTTRWPPTNDVISAAPKSALIAAPLPAPKPRDKILICGLEPDWDRLPAHRPQRGPLQEQWPRPQGTLVLALIVDQPETDDKRRPLCVGRHGDYWLRILDMRLPNYDDFDPEDEILDALGLSENHRADRAQAALAGLIRVTEEQFRRLLQVFDQRKAET